MSDVIRPGQTALQTILNALPVFIFIYFAFLVDAVKQARSVILVGGTMKPFDEFIDQIFLPAGKVDTDVSIFSCGHVINAKSQLAIYTTSVSFNNITWDFTFKVLCISSIYSCLLLLAFEWLFIFIFRIEIILGLSMNAVNS